jgi:hypothetical protein
MPKFIDFHPSWQVRPQTVERLRQAAERGDVDEHGVRQLEFFYSPENKGAYCVLEAPDLEAVRKHHGGTMTGEPMLVESLR